MTRRTDPASRRFTSPGLLIRPGTRRVTDAPLFRPDLVVMAVAVLGLLLLEVWQTSTVASLSMRVGRSVHALQQANAELAWTRSKLERSTSRSELGPIAGALGLRPMDPGQIVSLPEEYLEPAESRPALATSTPLLAFAGRSLQALVPDASARGRHVN